MKDDSMPLGSLTIGEFRELMTEILAGLTARDKKVYGIRGIEELFGVSHVTAQKYKDTIIREAVSQSGRKIVTDVEYALELFRKRKGTDNG